MRYVWDISEICLRYIWDVSEIYLRYAFDLSEKYLRYVRDTSEICLGYIWDISEIEIGLFLGVCKVWGLMCQLLSCWVTEWLTKWKLEKHMHLKIWVTHRYTCTQINKAIYWGGRPHLESNIWQYLLLCTSIVWQCIAHATHTRRHNSRVVPQFPHLCVQLPMLLINTLCIVIFMNIALIMQLHGSLCPILLHSRVRRNQELNMRPSLEVLYQDKSLSLRIKFVRKESITRISSTISNVTQSHTVLCTVTLGNVSAVFASYAALVYRVTLWNTE